MRGVLILSSPLENQVNKCISQNIKPFLKTTYKL